MPLASIQKKRNENSFRKFSDKRQRKRISDVLKDITNIDLSLGTENQESPTSTIFPDTEFGGLLSDFLLLISSMCSLNRGASIFKSYYSPEIVADINKGVLIFCFYVGNLFVLCCLRISSNYSLHHNMTRAFYTGNITVDSCDLVSSIHLFDVYCFFFYASISYTIKMKINCRYKRGSISKSIAKITSALTRRLPGKSSTVRRLPAYIRLLQAHRITNESHPPRIVSFNDSMNHKIFRIKNLGFFSSLWRESERYVVFSSQEWKKKKDKSILRALRASNWLFMVVVVLMTMSIL
ncbi:hypothetical protein YC2023_045340 [Brassica napus]